MFSTLRIQNFKGWEDTEEIRMAPITLFFGANSSGKSSIGHFLMLLKQTAESPDRKAVLHTGGKTSAVQLGSFKDIVYRHDKKKNISFEYSWSLNEPLQVEDPLTGEEFSGDKLIFSAEVGLGEEGQELLRLEKMTYQLVLDTGGILRVGLNLKPDKQEYKLSAAKYSFQRKQVRGLPLKEAVRFYGFPDTASAYYQNAEFIQDLNLAQETLLQSIYYLGPLRIKPDRLYSWTGIAPEGVGFSGENSIAALLASRNRKIKLKSSRAYKPLEQVVAECLKRMNLIEAFRVNPISEQRQEYEVKVRTKGSHDFVDLPDVGFGISQVLPVLIQCFYAPRDAIILMEQPEVHLHPAAQAALADILIDAINAREDGSERNIQLIIETHSEYFLRRLQRRIAEEALPATSVSAYFADVGRDPAALDPLEIDSYGNIRNWPKNFFGDEMGDVSAQARAGLERRMRSIGRDTKERP